MRTVWTRLRVGRLPFVTAVTVLAGLMLAVVASASHPEASLPGSNFEIDVDANTQQDDASPSIDWLTADSGNPVLVVDDEPSGQNDDSFGQGTKEDTPDPVVVDGSIPPNKSDLVEFGVYKEEEASGPGFLNLFWSRVQDPKGTTNMDFEFNQNKCVIDEQTGEPTEDSDCSGNGVTPERTAGDLLIVYELSKGGTVPELFLFTWLDGTEGIACESASSFPCWGDRTALGGQAAGSINESTVPQGSTVGGDVLGPYDPRTFGEAQVDLDAIFDANKCESFGSAYLKSRSSDSFPAALKDFIAPEPVNLTNCGKVIIRKQTDPEEDPNTTDFGYTKSFSTVPSSPNTFTLKDDGSKTFDNVLFGTGYTVTEDVIPSGWDFVSLDCSASTGVTPSVTDETVTFNIDNAADILDCTYTNRARGTIIVEKITDDGQGSFDFTSNTLPPQPPTPLTFTLTTTAAGNAGKDSRTFSDLVPATYDVAEIVPAGWNKVSEACFESSDPLTEINPSSIALGAGDTVTCTFHDARETGAILITKTRKHAAACAGEDPPDPCDPNNQPHAGVKFTVTGGELPAAGSEVTTGPDGTACLDGLVLSSFFADPGPPPDDGHYTVDETVPVGYDADGDTSKPVLVTKESTCGDGNEASVSFSNTPLTDITVSVDSQVDGGTASTIDCEPPDGDPPNPTPTDPDGDGILTLSDKKPDTYTCTVVVDP